MRKEKALIGLLRGLADLLVDESTRNPEFAARIESLLSDLPERKARPTKPDLVSSPEHQLDIHAEWNSRGETEFRLWLRDQPILVLRTVIRSQDLDPTRRTIKWKEAEKLAEFISDGLSGRLSRGSAFIGRRSDE
jgi:hypothetical protein